jgi:transcriptional regulator with XRE-family HTH domain
VGQESLAARLKVFREAKGLTKYRLAKVSGISEVYIYRLELGQIKNPRRDTLQKLAHGLGISVAELVGEAHPMDTWHLVEQSLRAYIPVYADVGAGEGVSRL